MAKNKMQVNEPMHIQADDFKLIRGIGPGIESRLHKAKILTFDQLAALTPEEIAGSVGNLIGMSAQRVADQDWIGQARRLAAESEAAETENERVSTNGHMHYAVFTIELLLDEANNVRRTRVLHVQSQSETTWAGWEEGRLVNFFATSADLSLPLPVEAPTTVMVAMEEAGMMSGQEARIDEISGKLQLHELAMKSSRTAGEQKLLFSDEPFNFNLTLDIVDLKAPPDVPLNYSAIIYAKRLGEGSLQAVGEKAGRLLPLDRVDLEVKGIKLSRGIYRIEALVELQTSLPDTAQPVMGHMAMTEGSLVQVI